MRRENLMARLLRAVSGKTQMRLAKEADIHQLCEESVRTASREVEGAAVLTRTATKVAARLPEAQGRRL